MMCYLTDGERRFGLRDTSTAQAVPFRVLSFFGIHIGLRRPPANEVDADFVGVVEVGYLGVEVPMGLGSLVGDGPLQPKGDKKTGRGPGGSIRVPHRWQTPAKRR